MRMTAFFILAILSGAVGQTLTSFSPSVSMLPGNGGTYGPATYTLMQYDTASGRSCIYAYYTDAANGYNSTIYSNSVYCLDYVPAGTSTLSQISLHLTANQNSGAPYKTAKMSGYYTTPTPWDRHPYFGITAGRLYLFDGLNASAAIRDTFFVDAATQINTGTGVFTSTNAIVPMLTKDAVRLRNSTGTVPGGLTNDTKYYFIRDGSNSFRLASTPDNAAAGTHITLSSIGSGTDTIYRDTLDTFYPSDNWTLNLATGAYGQFRLPVSTGWFRGNTFGAASTVIWHDYWQKFVRHAGKNYPATPEYSWTFDPADSAVVELTTRGNARDNTAPIVWSAQSMSYDNVRKRVWFFGDQDTVHTGTFEGAGNSLWRMDTASAWTEFTPVTPRPRMRKQHCSCYIPGEDKILVAGGLSSTNAQLVDVWLYDIGANSWDSLTTAVFPSGSSFTYCTYDVEHSGVVFLQATDNDWSFMAIGGNTPQSNPSGIFMLINGF